jgi:hypothetical protein
LLGLPFYPVDECNKFLRNIIVNWAETGREKPGIFLPGFLEKKIYIPNMNKRNQEIKIICKNNLFFYPEHHRAVNTDILKRRFGGYFCGSLPWRITCRHPCWYPHAKLYSVTIQKTTIRIIIGF